MSVKVSVGLQDGLSNPRTGNQNALGQDDLFVCQLSPMNVFVGPTWKTASFRANHISRETVRVAHVQVFARAGPDGPSLHWPNAFLSFHVCTVWVQ
jgi:hypothetical protein